MEGWQRLFGRVGPLLGAALIAGCAAAPEMRLPPPPVAQDEVVRLLEQASFGPTPETIVEVQRRGVAGYVDDQLRLPASRLPMLPTVVGEAKSVCGDAADVVGGAAATRQAAVNAAAPLTKPESVRDLAPKPSPAPADPAKLCRRDAFSDFPLQRRFFQNALTGPDQLRQRTAFALGQIFVVSGRKNNRAYAMARYQQLLLDDAFGSFRQLLADVTLSPMMGDYLDLANNAAAAGAAPAGRGTAPNENYAREVLQLFSVGLVQLHADGTPKLGPSGQPLATYGADEVRAFARAFTGWTYATAPGAKPKLRNPPYFEDWLQPVPAAHDHAPKTLLGGITVPGSTDPQRDLDAALDNIAQHPNVGPFIGRRLIQALVTSNPAPQYVARVSAVFDDDGHGVRGNLGAVVRAILLDPAARGVAKPDPGYGRPREPVLYLTGVLRALGGTGSDGVALIGQSAGMGQNVYVAPSVFNFYPPDHALATAGGESVYAPELAIVDSDTSLKRAAFADRLLFGAPFRPDPTVPGATGTAVSLTAWEPLAAEPDRLVDGLDALLLHHRLPPAARQAIADTVRSVPAADRSKRARTAAFLIVAGPQYQLQQ